MKKVSILLFALLAFSGFFGAGKALAQTNDLMIVEYVDWNPGDGFAIEIFNPTSQAINLSNYSVKTFHNGSNRPTNTIALSGMLAPCATIVVGNDAYCNNNCDASCNISDNATGVNGDDIIALTTGSGNTFVDMIGRFGGNHGYKIDNVSNALYWHRIVREPGNTTRYTATNGTAANSWPRSASTNVTGWKVEPVSCIVKGHSLGKLTVDLGPDQALCSGGTVTLNAGHPGATYRWSTGATTPTITVSTSGTYVVNVTNGCSSGSDTVVVNIGASLQLDAGADQVVCPGTPVRLEAVAGGFNNVLWTGGSGTFSSTDSARTIYTPGPQDTDKVTLTLIGMSTNCGMSSDKITIFFSDSVQASYAISYSPANPTTEDEIQFTVDASHAFTAQSWYFSDQPSNPHLSATHRFTQPGDYDITVEGINRFGCPVSARTSITVTEVERTLIPNVFTPNNDGKNDRLDIVLPKTRTYKLLIMNRWGSVVFESDSQDNDWDGKDAADGNYFMYLKAELQNGKKLEIRQPVSLFR